MIQSRIRVAELVNGFAVEGPGGGASRFGISLGKSLDQTRFQPRILGLWNFGMAYEKERLTALNEAGILAHAATDWQERNPYRSFWMAYQNLRKFFSSHAVDILHSHSEFGDIAALFLKIVHRRLILIRTIHNGYPIEWRKRPIRRLFLTNLLYPFFFSAEIGVNQAIVDQLDKRWIARILNKKAIWQPNAIDLNRFIGITESKRGLLAELSIDKNTFIVGSIGRLAIEKGIEDLLQAASLVVKANPHVFFVIVGEGDLRAALVDIAENLGISKHVRFTGARPDIEAMYGCFDVLVNSSLWEGLSTVILEGLAARVPVIATDIPGNQAILTHGKNSLIVPPARPDKLAKAILEIAEDHPLRSLLIKNGLETVESYRIEAITQSHEILYQRLFQKHT